MFPHLKVRNPKEKSTPAPLFAAIRGATPRKRKRKETAGSTHRSEIPVVVVGGCGVGYRTYRSGAGALKKTKDWVS